MLPPVTIVPIGIVSPETPLATPASLLPRPIAAPSTSGMTGRTRCFGNRGGETAAEA
jgi:hypothetical protein